MQNRINNLGEYVIDRSVEIRNGQYGKDQKYHEDPFRAVNFRIDEQGVMRCPTIKHFTFYTEEV